MPKKPLIHILAKLRSGPWGGGNQFLKALKKELRKMGVYTDQAEEADIILFNNFPFGAEYLFKKICKIKLTSPQTIIIYRVDGPISLVRGRDLIIDKIISRFAREFADGLVFQSQWSAAQNRQRQKIFAPYEKIIHNAPDPTLFKPPKKTKPKLGQKVEPHGQSPWHPPFRRAEPAEAEEGKHSSTSKARGLLRRRVKLVTTTWSPNPRKGFAFYQYLDQHLDFKRYTMTLIGPAPVKFQKIKHHKASPPPQLALILKKKDIFITASSKDPCSNALIEALSCGLPAVALNDGGHPELVQAGGELFHNKKDLLSKIEKVALNYSHYQKHLPQFSLADTTRAYYSLAQKIYADTQKKEYSPKRIKKTAFWKIQGTTLWWKLTNRIEQLCTHQYGF